MFTSITKELSRTKIAECIMKYTKHQIDNEYESSDIASQGDIYKKFINLHHNKCTHL